MTVLDPWLAEPLGNSHYELLNKDVWYCWISTAESTSYVINGEIFVWINHGRAISLETEAHVDEMSKKEIYWWIWGTVVAILSCFILLSKGAVLWKCDHKPRLRWKLFYERIWNMVNRSFLYLRLPQMSRLCLYYHKSLVFGSCCVTRLMPVSISPPPLPWKVMDSQDNSISCSLTCPHSWSVHWGDEQLRKHWFLGLSSCFWLVLLFKSNSWEWAWGCINELSPTL